MTKQSTLILGAGVTGLIALGAMGGSKPAYDVAPVSYAEADESYYAEINENGEVVRVIVASDEFINSEKLGKSQNWIKVNKSNYPGTGDIYDKEEKKFLRLQVKQEEIQEIK